MADDGAAGVIAGGGTWEPIGSELGVFCNRLRVALNDESRLLITLATASAHQDDGAEPSPAAALHALLAGEPGGGRRHNDAWPEWEEETRAAARALLASDNSPENAAMLISVACHLDGGGMLKPLGAAGTLHALRRQWEATKKKTSCFDENLRQLVGTAVGFDNFVVWLAGTMNGHRTYGYWRYGIGYRTRRTMATKHACTRTMNAHTEQHHTNHSLGIPTRPTYMYPVVSFGPGVT